MSRHDDRTLSLDPRLFCVVAHKSPHTRRRSHEEGKEALDLAEELSADKRLRGEGRMLKARLATLAGDDARARNELEANVREQPTSHDALEALCQFLFERGPVQNAKQALQKLVQLSPTDPAAQHNLGMICLRSGSPAEAVTAFQESLRQRPNWPPTYLQLGHALRQCGRVNEAVAAWTKVLELSPGDPDALAAIAQARANPKTIVPGTFSQPPMPGALSGPGG